MKNCILTLTCSILLTSCSTYVTKDTPAIMPVKKEEIFREVASNPNDDDNDSQSKAAPMTFLTCSSYRLQGGGCDQWSNGVHCISERLQNGGCDEWSNGVRCISMRLQNGGCDEWSNGVRCISMRLQNGGCDQWTGNGFFK